MQRVSKAFYLGSIGGGIGLAMVVGLIGLGVILSGEKAGMALVGLAYVPMIYGVVVVCVLVYKMWAAIQDGRPRTTPGKAVGFMFIPLFNFYWGFQVFWGWTKDYNQYTASRGIAAPKMPEQLALVMCILTLCAIIPFLGYLIVLVNVILMIVFYAKACDGINALADARAAAPAPGVA